MGDGADVPVHGVGGAPLVVAALSGERGAAEDLEVPDFEVLVAVPIVAAFEAEPGGVVGPIAASIELARAEGEVGEGERLDRQRVLVLVGAVEQLVGLGERVLRPALAVGHVSGELRAAEVLGEHVSEHVGVLDAGE